MADQPKLTPTFTDLNGKNAPPQVVPIGPFPPMPPVPVAMQPFPKTAVQMFPQPRVVAAHEPLSEDTKNAIPPVSELLGKLESPAPPVAPVAEPQHKKIALIGTAPTSRGLAPYHDPSWTIWACSPGNMGQIPRADVWFELHGNLLWPECKSYGEPYIEWLKKLPIPLYMQSQEWVPNAMIFPVKDMVAKFGRDFFTSSFTWMMAFAIDQGCKELALYGIDMASRNEYILQRPGFYFFKYIAEQRGIKVSAPNESDIMQPPGLYGYSDVTPMGRKILAREVELTQRLTQMRQQRDQLHQSITYLEGAAEDIDYFKSIWMGQG